MNPMIQNPIPVAIAILRNSVLVCRVSVVSVDFEYAGKESLHTKPTFLSWFLTRIDQHLTIFCKIKQRIENHTTET